MVKIRTRATKRTDLRFIITTTFLILGTKKAPRPQSTGTKGKPSAVPPAFVSKTIRTYDPITADQPSPSLGPLPGEPSDPILQGGFQPVTAPLC